MAKQEWSARLFWALLLPLHLTALQFTAVQGLAGPQGRESVVQPLTCQQIPTVLTGSHRQPQKAVRDKRGGAYS